MNVEVDQQRVGKVRFSAAGPTATIFSIMIFPEFERKGLASMVVRQFKRNYPVIVADRVKYKATGFWEKMGFTGGGDGNYYWSAD